MRPTSNMLLAFEFERKFVIITENLFIKKHVRVACELKLRLQNAFLALAY